MRARLIIPIFKKTRWSPYVAGALIGVVSWFSVLTTGRYLGVSTTFVRTIGMIEKLLTPSHISALPYFLKEKPLVDWQWMEALGILIGAFIAAKLSGDFQMRFVPSGEAFWECSSEREYSLRHLPFSKITF